MSSESNNGKVQDKRGGFLDKVENEKAPESPTNECDRRNDADTKPRGTFLEPSTGAKVQTVRKPAACSYRGG